MTILNLKCDSVRLPYGKKSDGELEDRITKYIGLHQIANTVLVLCGKRPMSSRLTLKRTGSVSTDELYNKITSGQVPVSFTFRYGQIDILTEFKKEGRNTGSAKTGEYNEQWFHNCYRKQRGDYNPRLVGEFKEWMRCEFHNVGLDTFANLMTELERRIRDCAKSKNMPNTAAAKIIIPERFHEFNIFFGSEHYYNSLSKFCTKPYFVKLDGSIHDKSEAGSIVLTGGPLWMINCGFRLSLDLEHKDFLTVIGDIETGPGAATIGDGGVCVLDREMHND